MTKLLLVRHGESQANAMDAFIGHTDLDLTELGYRQAAITAEFIARTYPDVHCVLASDLQRAYHTGEAIAKRLQVPITPDRDLREIYAGAWETKTFNALDVEFVEDYELWKRDVGNSRCTGGESVRELAARIEAELTRIAKAYAGKTVVLAFHATPIRSMLCVLDGHDLSDMQRIPWPTNASVTEVDYENGTWRVVKASQDAHLAQYKTFVAKNV